MNRKLKKVISAGLIMIGLAFIAAAAVLSWFNIEEDVHAGNAAAEEMPLVLQAVEANRAEMLVTGDDSEGIPGEPLYKTEPLMEMPTATIDGRTFVAVIRIPSQEIDLPVISEFTYDDLKSFPCRYAGSAYRDNLVICGHNYRSHFQKIRNCMQGDIVELEDMDGNIFRYVVSQVDTLGAYEHEAMVDSEWDLTLFTCTFDSRSRVTVRCYKEADNVILTD